MDSYLKKLTSALKFLLCSLIKLKALTFLNVILVQRIITIFQPPLLQEQFRVWVTETIEQFRRQTFSNISVIVPFKGPFIYREWLWFVSCSSGPGNVVFLAA